MKALGWLVAWIGVVAVGSAWSGYVLSILWGWFIVPQFEGAPRLSVASAIGLALVVRFLVTNYKDTQKSDTDHAEWFAEMTFIAIFWPLFALAFGYVVRGFL